MAHIPYKDHLGNDKTFFIDDYLQRALDIAISRVKRKNWDYVCIVSGLPGSGKSTLAKTIAKYCDPNFTVDNIAFSDKGKDGFIDISNRLPDYSSVILDESFASLNSKVGMTSEFLNIINHLQLLRQKHLFIILCLPNFFDLGKPVSIFRSSHLFVTYDTEGDRGSFLAFDRNAKRKLFIMGHKFIDYNVVKANFRGQFTINHGIIDEDEYNRRKREHLLSQEQNTKKKRPEISKYFNQRNIVIAERMENTKITSEELSKEYTRRGFPISRRELSEIRNRNRLK
jgi:predicted ATPase